MSDRIDFEHTVVIVGASARAAAVSALRCGLTPIGVDLFADLDLAARCRALTVPATQYPLGFSDVLDSLPPGPWMYTGGIENHPKLVGRMAARRRLWGNDAATLTAVRDPVQVSRCLADAGLPHPQCRTTRPVGDPSAWLVKPRAGAGGSGITALTDPMLPVAKPVYYQQRLEGEPCAAVYVGYGDEAELLGVTRQLIGESELGAGPFVYCGSIGPVVPRTHGMQLVGLWTRYVDIGNALTARFNLRGLFGVDCIMQHGVPQPVEVNPRYTASVEVIERATGIQSIALHREACEHRRSETPHSAFRNPHADVVGKAVVYAPDDLMTPELPHDSPDVADIPRPGTIIPKGRPVLTVFAESGDVAACRVELLQRARQVLARCERINQPQSIGVSEHV